MGGGSFMGILILFFLEKLTNILFLLLEIMKEKNKKVPNHHPTED